MAIHQGTLTRRQTGRSGLHLAAHVGGTILATAVRLPAGLAVRAVFGRDIGPRGATREKFPECQWQQIMAGKRNWFQ